MAESLDQPSVNELIAAFLTAIVVAINQPQAAPVTAPPPAQQAQLPEPVFPNQPMGNPNPPQRRRLQELAVINSYRNLQGPNFVPHFKDGIKWSREGLLPGDREALRDLAEKLYRENHPVGESPDEEWIEK
jgi:hypothetical protein